MEISNPDKVMFPDTGTTKAELVGHYKRVAPLMLPWVADRPLTLERYPNGTGQKGFLQKNASKHFPDFVGRVEVPKNDGTVNHPVIDSADGLTYLANQGTITFHVWTSRIPRLDVPDRLVMDLDPSEDDLGKMRSVVDATRETMVSFGLEPVLVASGSRGFHLWAAIEPDHEYEAVGAAAWCLGALIAAGNPDTATTEFLKKERGDAVFVDWLRNRWAQSIACPYSLRSRHAPTVVTPLRWDELKGAVPTGWDIETIADRLADPPAPPQPTALDVDAIVAAAADAGIDPSRIHDRFRG